MTGGSGLYFDSTVVFSTLAKSLVSYLCHEAVKCVCASDESMLCASVSVMWVWCSGTVSIADVEELEWSVSLSETSECAYGDLVSVGRVGPGSVA